MRSSVVKMRRAARHALTRPVSANEDQRRSEYALNIVLIGSIAAFGILEVLTLVVSRSQFPYSGISFAELFSLQISFFGLYLLSRHGRYVAATYLAVGTYFAGVSYVAYEWGANWEVTVLGYALVIVVASVLLGTRWGFFTTVVVGAFVTLLRYAQWYGVVAAPKAQEPAASDAIIFAALYFLIMLVAWLSNRETERSLARARMSETALKKERDALEWKVEERTKELRRKELEKIERMYQFAELGRLSSGLLHDLLNVVNEAMLQERRALPRTAKGKLSGAFRANRRIERFTQAIRHQLVSRDTCETFSLAESVEGALELLSYKAKKSRVRISFLYEPDEDLLWRGNPFKVHQVVMNLIANAIDACDGSSGRAVRVGVERREGAFVISVIDEGCGVDPSLREKIFEPFFTTKEEGRGMGIGLTTAKRIVEEDIGGAISVASELGKYTAFTVTLPNGPLDRPF